MSFLVRYTLKSAGDHGKQVQAMETLVAGLKSEDLSGLHYSCFSTDEPASFIGLLEFEDEAAKQAFLGSASFASYRETVGPLFANPPQTSDVFGIATTRE